MTRIPAIAVAELMRLLVDEHAMDWDTAWAITRQTFAYTNHTLLPEALERWPLALFRRFCRATWRSFSRSIALPGRSARPVLRRRSPRRQLSIIDESGRTLYAHGAPGLRGQPCHQWRRRAAYRTSQDRLVEGFLPMWPEKFFNRTNGVTPRRWIALSNPGLTAADHRRLATDWVRICRACARSSPSPRTPCSGRLAKLKHANKAASPAHPERTGVLVDPNSLFDVQVKRIHEYKRQHLNVLT